MNTYSTSMFRALGYGVAVLGMALLSMLPDAANAQYPDKPLTLVNGFPPGGNADVVARLVAQKLSERLGQTIVVDNRAGAGGLIASDYVSRSKPDGYVLLLVSGAFPTQAATMKKLPFDPIKGFTWVSTMISYPLLIGVGADSPLKTVADIVATAKANPGKLNFASPGAGSLYHLATEQFAAAAGVQMTHVPFKGGAQPLSEVMAGRIDLTFDTVSVLLPQIQGGRMRAIAVASPARSPLLPNTPTVAESLPGYEASSFLGIAGPPGMPKAITDRLNQEIRYVVALPEIQQKFAELGGTPFAGSPADMEKYVAGEIAKWKQIVASLHFELL